MSKKIKELQDIANILREDVLEMTSAAGSGHPTSCLSCADIISCLFFNEMKYDIGNADNPDNDEFILRMFFFFFYFFYNISLQFFRCFLEFLVH